MPSSIAFASAENFTGEEPQLPPASTNPLLPSMKPVKRAFEDADLLPPGKKQKLSDGEFESLKKAGRVINEPRSRIQSDLLLAFGPGCGDVNLTEAAAGDDVAMSETSGQVEQDTTESHWSLSSSMLPTLPEALIPIRSKRDRDDSDITGNVTKKQKLQPSSIKALPITKKQMKHKMKGGKAVKITATASVFLPRSLLVVRGYRNKVASRKLEPM